MFDTKTTQNNEQKITELIANTMGCEIIGTNIAYYDDKNRGAGEVDAVLTNKNNEIVFLEIKEPNCTVVQRRLCGAKLQLKRAIYFFDKQHNVNCAWKAQEAWVALLDKKGIIHLYMNHTTAIETDHPWHKIKIMHHE